MENFTSAGSELIAISPQIPKYSRTLIKAKKLTFEILCDPGNTVAQKFAHTIPEDLRKIYLRFGIDLPKTNGDDSWTLPLPARFIIDREAVIRYAKTDVDYTVRPDPAHTLEALKHIL